MENTTGNKLKLSVPTMSAMAAKGDSPDVLFWVGCAGSFDQRAQKITKAFVKILNKAQVKFAILGPEEACTGDPARRAGNEFLFQMMAMNNISVLQGYDIKKIVTACPHCFNTLKNEYPELGGKFEVIHHTTFINQLLKDGKLSIDGGAFKGKKITYHDSCYLGRANGVYEAPRDLIKALDAELVEMKRCKSNGLCCGAGGAQMFKEEEKGSTRINLDRADEIANSGAEIVAAACPFCMTMVSDGLKESKPDMKSFDIVELIANAQDI